MVKKISLVSEKKVADPVKTVKFVNIKKMSDDEIETAFRSAFEDQVVYNNDFGGETDFDVKIVRDSSKNTVKIERKRKKNDKTMNAVL